MLTDIIGESLVWIYFGGFLFHLGGFIFVSGPCDSVIHWASDFMDSLPFSN